MAVSKEDEVFAKFREVLESGGALALSVAEVSNRFSKAKATTEDTAEYEISTADREEEIVRILTSGLEDGEEISSTRRNELYAELLSDNMGNNNKTQDAGDGTQIDVSEMTLLSKTKLRGTFRTTDETGARLDSFESPKAGDTKEVCGGTLTYVKQGAWGSSVDADKKPLIQWKGWLNFEFSQDYVAVTDEQRGTIVQYDGVLGHFQYNTRDFELSYYEAEVNGSTISVPVLHYRGDKPMSLIPSGTVSIVDGACITIPEGLEVADYMFADTNIESMPDLSGCKTLTSAHCMFLNCMNMTEGCTAAQATGNTGAIKFPPNLEDMSWMFAGSGMRQFFDEIGENVIDARCAAQDCTNLGFIPDSKLSDPDDWKNTFQMPNMTKTRWLLAEFCDDMFDNTPPEVVSKVQAYCESHDGHIGSDWVEENGTHNNIFDRVEDGSYDPDKLGILKDAAAKYNIYKMMDPDSKGKSGVEALTADMASSVSHEHDGIVTNNQSTWATLLQSEKSYNAVEANPYGELADRAVAFGATYGILKGLTKSNLIAVGVAGAAQVVGFANKITPILDTVSGFLGNDHGVGKFLADMSNKLKSSEVHFNTQVSDLDVDEVFGKQQKASMQYAFAQMESAFGGKYQDYLTDTDGYSVATQYNLTKYMEENGASIAKDGNLIVIAMTPETELSKNLNQELMRTCAEAIGNNLREDAGTDKTGLTQVLQEEYSTYFLNLMKHIDSYSDGAESTIDDKYRWDEAGKAAAQNGLEKVIRNTAAPVYEEMRKLQDEYGLFSEDQLNKLDAMAPYGMPKFSEYQAGQDLTPESDPYVEALESHREERDARLEAATSDEERAVIMKEYYEAAYSHIIAEAESQGVLLDTKSDAVMPEQEADSGSPVDKYGVPDVDTTADTGDVQYE